LLHLLVFNPFSWPHFKLGWSNKFTVFVDPCMRIRSATERRAV
jgi:hypothetical protein